MSEKRCYLCGGQVSHMSDFAFEDECREGEGIIHHYRCMNCGAEIEVSESFNEEDESENRIDRR